jgi:hypothetical protein
VEEALLPFIGIFQRLSLQESTTFERHIPKQHLIKLLGDQRWYDFLISLQSTKLIQSNIISIDCLVHCGIGCHIRVLLY